MLLRRFVRLAFGERKIGTSNGTRNFLIPECLQTSFLAGLLVLGRQHRQATGSVCPELSREKEQMLRDYGVAGELYPFLAYTQADRYTTVPFSTCTILLLASPMLWRAPLFRSLSRSVSADASESPASQGKRGQHQACAVRVQYGYSAGEQRRREVFCPDQVPVLRPAREGTCTSTRTFLLQAVSTARLFLSCHLLTLFERCRVHRMIASNFFCD